VKENGKAMVLASFVADSLALGAHWIYDTDRIKSRFGRIESLLEPASDSYHPTKDKGDFTHYGDQAFVLLESVAAKGEFVPEDFSCRWKDLFKGYNGYFDKATKETLQNLASGKKYEEAGSPSQDLAGASRIAALVYRYPEEIDALVQAARTQAKMTHNHPLVIDSAEFFARVASSVLKGESPVSSMEEISQKVFRTSPLSEWVRKGIQSKGEESVSVISHFGQTCSTEQVCPGVVHLLARYEENLKEALIQAVMAGGDNAARGMIVAMVLGAYLGEEAIPAKWISDLKKKEDIFRLLDKLS